MMKGMLKRALGVVAAAAMAVTGMAALSGTANAAVDDIVTTPASITINAGDESQFTDRDLKYIKLAEYDVYEAADQSSVLSIYTVDNVRSYVEKALATATADEDPYNAGTDGDPMAWIANNLDNSGEAPYSGVLRDFVTELYDDADFVKLITSKMTTTGSGTSRTYTMTDADGNAAPGVYLIVDEGATTVGNAATQAIPMLVGTQIKVKVGAADKPVVPGTPDKNGYLGGVVNLKNELTSVTKTVSGEGAIPGVGDTRTYTITGKVPNWVGKDLSDNAKPQFTFTDTPGKGQTVDYSSINVQLVRKDDVDPGFTPFTEDVPRDQYTVTQYVAVDASNPGTGFTTTEVNPGADQPAELKADGASYFVVDLTGYMKTIAQNTGYFGVDVVLTYNVTVNADAVDLKDDITNKVMVNNNGSTNEDSASLPKPQTITFRKTDRDNNVLAGAQFSLVKNASTDDVDDAFDRDSFANVVPTVPGVDGSYVVDPTNKNGLVADGESTTVTNGDGTTKVTLHPLISGTDGMVTVKGLGEGTYTVTETHAPDGFIEVGLPSFTVTIGHDAGGSPTVDYDDKDSDPFGLVTMPIKNDPLTVMNVRSITQLPLTGAAGTMLFTVLGLLIAGAGALVYMKSRNVKRALRG